MNLVIPPVEFFTLSGEAKKGMVKNPDHFVSSVHLLRKYLIGTWFGTSYVINPAILYPSSKMCYSKVEEPVL